MINTTDFLNALRTFEYVAKIKNLPKYFKVKAKIHLLIEHSKLGLDICNIDLVGEMEVIEGTNEALKNL